jgi:hypothetical protein
MSSSVSIQTITEKAFESQYASWVSAANSSGGLKGRNARIVADYIRHALCRFAAEEGNAGAVHIQRLRSAVSTQLDWMIPPVDEPPWAARDDSPDEEPGESSASVKDLFSLTLERLILLGDCGGIGGGYYVPAPLRRIVLGSGRSLVVGGLDTKSLVHQAGGEVGLAGLARTIEKATVDLPSLQLRDWLALPEEPLPQWTKRVMSRATSSLHSTPGLDASDFEIYSPVSHFRSGQSNRWASPRHWTPPHNVINTADTLHLCRTKRRPRRFWLAPLDQARQEVRFRRETPVERADSRRLMYGIDQLFGKPTKATVQRSGTDAVEFRLYSWLPIEEYRLFTALCYQTQNAPETPLPFIFHVQADHWPDVATALKGLGIIAPESSNRPL